MNYAEQKSKLKEIISKRSDLEVVVARAGGHLDELKGAVKDLFSMYERIAKRDGSFEVGLDLICKSTYFNECISIGHAEYWDIVFYQGDDRIYIVDGSESSLMETDSVYENIYHYLFEELVE